MEENTLIESTELACKAILAKKWGMAIGAATTSMGIENFEIDNELEQNEDIYSTDASLGLNIGLNVAGPLAGENSYVMGLPEWVDYYWPFVGQQGLVCLIPETLKDNIDYGHSVYPAAGISKTPFRQESNQVITFSKASAFGPPLSEELLSFCARHNMLSSLQVSLALIRTCFPSSREVRAQTEQDPDTGEEWLVLDFEIAGEIKEILDSYDKYTDFWVRSVRWPEREKIRLSYNIV